jgi:hypothetical protein
MKRPSSRLSLANNNPVIEVGDRVTVISSGNRGICRFSGSTDFAGGHWIGVELDNPEGKNDGSLEGIQYFEASENHGIFVRAGQLQLVRDSRDCTTDNLRIIPLAKVSDHLYLLLLRFLLLLLLVNRSHRTPRCLPLKRVGSNLEE